VEKNLLIFLLQGIPEGMASAYFGLTVFGLRFKTIDIIVIGLLHALMALFVRSLPFTFGVHGVILAVWLTVVIYLRLRCPIIKAIGATLLSGGMLAIFETVLFIVLINGFGMEYEAILANPVQRTLVGLTSPFVLILLAAIFTIAHLGARGSKGRNASV
jgi:hypothetical protein